MDKSYKKYEKYQDNKRRFKTNQIAFPIAVLIIIAIVSEFWWLIPLGIIGVVVAVVVVKLDEKRQQQSVQKTTNTQPTTNNEVEKMAKSKETTEAGYINKNNQLNHGRSDKDGNDHNQYFYNMECLLCGHTYYANGSDIWQRKCPKCQGGK